MYRQHAMYAMAGHGMSRVGFAMECHLLRGNISSGDKDVIMSWDGMLCVGPVVKC